MFWRIVGNRIIGLQGAPNAQIILNVSLSDEISKSEIFALSAPLRLKNSRIVGLWDYRIVGGVKHSFSFSL